MERIPTVATPPKIPQGVKDMPNCFYIVSESKPEPLVDKLRALSNKKTGRYLIVPIQERGARNWLEFLPEVNMVLLVWNSHGIQRVEVPQAQRSIVPETLSINSS
jgi:hypothetical protein